MYSYFFGAAPGVRQCESGRKDSLWRCGCPGLFPRSSYYINNRLNLRKPIIECALELELELEHPSHRSSSWSRCQVPACHKFEFRSVQKKEM